MKRCIVEREAKLIEFQQEIDEKQAATTSIKRRKLVHDTSETAENRATFHKATKAKRNLLEKSLVPENVDTQCQFSNPGTRSLKMVIRVPKNYQINKKQIAVKNTELVDNDIHGINSEQVKFHAAAKKPNVFEKSVIKGNTNVQCQSSKPGTQSLKMVIRVPKNCQQKLSSMTTEVKPKQQNTLEKSPITINSNTQSQSSDSDTENFKTVTLESKKCPRKSSSAITKKKAPLMQKALKYIKFIKTVRGH